jgi:glycerol-3-phosphate acyltransferase PlsX
MKLLKQKKVAAFVSTGNTGALVALAQLHLSLFDTIQKPALLVSLPSEKGEVVVLDVGAHIAFKAQHLLDYARLGVAYSTIVYGFATPSVGLLNIGVEEAKGTKEVQEAYIALQRAFSEEQFVGNVEGREVFQGKVDVLVTDGFTGNVFLKTCEGASSFLLEYMHNYFSKAPSSSGEPLMHHFEQRFNYSSHRGAFLCGVEGIVIKCHGNASNPAFIQGIQRAFELAEMQIGDKIQKKLKQV